MTYDQILTLDYIVKLGSFKAAAQAMYKSQPSLSMAIKKLEEEFDVSLFNRDGYRPVLTEEGRAFYQKAIRAIEQFKELEKLGQELGAGHEPHIRICADAVFPIHKISPILHNFFDPHVSTKLDLSSDVLAGVVDRVKKHEVDFGIGPDMGTDPDIEKVKLLDSKIIPVVGKFHQDKIGDINFLRGLPQIVVGSSVASERENFRGAISNQHWHTTDFYMKEQLIESGLGWGSLAYHQVAPKIKSGDLFEIKGIKEIRSYPVPMYLQRSRTKIMGPNAKNLWNYLAKMGGQFD